MFGFSKLDIMFGKRTLEAVRLPYRDRATPDVRLRQETITAIDPAARRVVTDHGTYGADVLVVALGAGYDVAATPGLAEAGHEFYSVRGAEAVRDVLPSFRSGSAIVGVCGAPFKCPPAPSEAAILLDEDLRERGVRDAVRISVVIPFGTPVPLSPAPRRRSWRGSPNGASSSFETAGSPRWTRPRARPCSMTAAACRSTCSWASRCTGRRRSSRSPG